jgi:hypothetical protein
LEIIWKKEWLLEAEEKIAKDRDTWKLILKEARALCGL